MGVVNGCRAGVPSSPPSDPVASVRGQEGVGPGGEGWAAVRTGRADQGWVAGQGKGRVFTMQHSSCSSAPTLRYFCRVDRKHSASTCCASAGGWRLGAAATARYDLPARLLLQAACRLSHEQPHWTVATAVGIRLRPKRRTHVWLSVSHLRSCGSAEWWPHASAQSCCNERDRGWRLKLEAITNRKSLHKLAPMQAFCH